MSDYTQHHVPYVSTRHLHLDSKLNPCQLHPGTGLVPCSSPALPAPVVVVSCNTLPIMGVWLPLAPPTEARAWVNLPPLQPTLHLLGLRGSPCNYQSDKDEVWRANSYLNVAVAQPNNNFVICYTTPCCDLYNNWIYNAGSQKAWHEWRHCAAVIMSHLHCDGMIEGLSWVSESQQQWKKEIVLQLHIVMRHKLCLFLYLQRSTHRWISLVCKSSHSPRIAL